jgi:hypothetical protein
VKSSSQARHLPADAAHAARVLLTDIDLEVSGDALTAERGQWITLRVEMSGAELPASP